jgi:hypothetical protein
MTEAVNQSSNMQGTKLRISFAHEECLICLTSFEELVDEYKIVFAKCQHAVCNTCWVKHCRSGLPSSGFTPCCRQPRLRNRHAASKWNITQDNVGDYFVISPNLFASIGLELDMSRLPGDFDLCAQLVEVIDPGEEPGLNIHFSHPIFQSQRHCNDRELGRGPYFKFRTSIRFMWNFACESNIVPVDDDPTVLLERWMVNLIQPVGENFLYNRVVTFPNTFGWLHPRFVPLIESSPEPTLFERFEFHDDDDEIAMNALCCLPDDHPLRWVGWDRGLRFGKHWKMLREHVCAKNIVAFWKKAAKVQPRKRTRVVLDDSDSE